MNNKEKITVIKVGGAILEDETSLSLLLDHFTALPGKKILVHGGGRAATRLAASMGIESKMVEGRRITDEKMLEIVTMVYGGLVNKRTVSALQARGVNALGLTGADMDIIRGHKRPVKEVDYGWVGDVDYANGQALHALIQQDVVPVVAPLIHDGQGHMLNTNADTIASQVACALSAYYHVTLTFCFEKSGVLSNPDDEQSVIPRISEESLPQLLEDGIISGGMIPKIENALKAIKDGVSQVIITKASNLDGSKGTLIE